MPRTHYQVLGIKKNATADDIRSAYRKLVLKLHPDRSSDPKATELFIRVTEAYEVLSDPNRRRSYDALQEVRPQEQEQVRTTGYGGKVSPGYPPQREPQPARGATITVDVTRLTMLFSRGQFGEAEKLAKRILSTDNRQPIPYAVLGDLARSRGDLPGAAKMFALAVQMDPKNPLYQKRYEEIVRADPRLIAEASRRQETPANTQLYAPYVGGALVLLGCGYLALSHEAAFLGEWGLISTWTLGLIVILFLSGVSIGASLSTAGLLDPLQSLNVNSLGRPSPTLALGFVAVVSFWAAAALYGLLGMSQRAFNLSTTRIVSTVAGATALLAISAASGGFMDGFQVLLWGGNLVYLGSLTGWTVADSFRR